MDIKEIELELRSQFPELVELDFSLSQCGVRWRGGTTSETKARFHHELCKIWGQHTKPRKLTYESPWRRVG